MPKERATIFDLFDTDQRNLNTYLDRLEREGILELFSQIFSLMEELISEVSTYKASLNYPTPKTSSKAKIASWNSRLRANMYGSALCQFVFALSHLCRAQTSEVYGHMRRAI